MDKERIQIIQEITSKPWQRKPMSTLFKNIKATLSTLREPGELSENRFFEKELVSLLKDKSGFYLYFTDSGLPVLGEVLSQMDTLDEETVISCIQSIQNEKYLSAMDIDTLIWQTKYCLIHFMMKEKHADSYGHRIASLSDLDMEKIIDAVNPLHERFMFDETYRNQTRESRALYRNKVALTALHTGIEEQRLSFEYRSFAERNQADLGELIFKDYHRVFSRASVRGYLFFMLTIPAILSFFAAYITTFWVFIPLYICILAGIKPICDYFASRRSKGCELLPRMDLEQYGGIPDSARTLCVISTLITDEKSISEALTRYRAAKIRNKTNNLYYCLLCDLKQAKNETVPADEDLLLSCEKQIRELGADDLALILRKRSFSRTQGVYQGWERKRGAIEQLVKHLSGQPQDFLRIFGNEKVLEGIVYIAALDFDTLPLMDTIPELVSIVIHPLNKNKGIIVPRITTTLASSLKTVFSKLMTGNGGCSSVSAYDSFAGEFYHDTFHEGIFAGKGLIRVSDFLEKACDRFPIERVLSHDILEGGVLGVAYAGDVEFSDGFPPNSNAYFKRLQRWYRGDLQNLPFIFQKNITPLQRFKLFDNIRRVLTPISAMLCFVAGLFLSYGWILFLGGLFALLTPYLMSFVPSVIRGMNFANRRRFYSPVLPQTKQLLRQIVTEILILPKNFTVACDALIRTVIRSITRKNLLEWTTSAFFEKKKGGFMHLIPAQVCALVFLSAAVWTRSPWGLVLGILFCCVLPLLYYCDREYTTGIQHIPTNVLEGLKENVQKMWRFYEDFTTEHHHFLPPDNVQYAPVFRISERTSPTNIGMYLLSCISARIFELITDEQLIQRIDATITTVESMKKWNGNLYNWYVTTTLETLSPFVSSVDSGNFVCCLIAVKEGLRHYNLSPSLIKRLETIISETNIGIFYNNTKHLFSLGYDTEKESFSTHCYDLLMSEARMMSYFAIASGQVSKKHWRYLGRTMTKCGHYAAPISWTGTMFEYFMPELLLQSKEGSMSYEALRFALMGQKKRGKDTGLPFGMSESGYYAFDNDLNYQYKAHGEQLLGLKSGLNKERVVSPYSSFLTLSHDIYGAYNNLVRLKKEGVYDHRYGFYEAVDYTPSRVGKKNKAIVKSHMAHHVGMSMAGATNAVYDGALQKLFLSDEQMQRGQELLEERIMAGEQVLEPMRVKEEQENTQGAETVSNPDVFQPRVNLLSNGMINAIHTDSGVAQTIYEGKIAVRDTTDLVLNPRGMFFGLVEDKNVYSFAFHPIAMELEGERKAERCVVYSQSSSEYFLNAGGLQTGMKITLGSDYAAEIREFAIQNTTSSKRQLTLCCYFEPILAFARDAAAHPAFMDLFLKVWFDREKKLFFAVRKDRHSDEKTVMCIGFKDSQDFTYSLNREDVLRRNESVFTFFEKGNRRESSGVSVPCPCVFIKADLPVDAKKKVIAKLFCCYGKSVEEVTSISKRIRNNGHKEENIVTSPLVYDTIHGRLARRILPYLLYGGNDERTQKSILKNKLPKTELYRYGLSGNLPIVLYDCSDGTMNAAAVIDMKKVLGLCGVQSDLVFITDNEAQKKHLDSLARERLVSVCIVDREELGSERLALLKAICAYYYSQDSFQPKKQNEIPKKLLYPKTVKNVNGNGEDKSRSFTGVSFSKNNTVNDFNPHNNANLDLQETSISQANDYGYFSEEGFIITKEPQNPWSTVLANDCFGTLLTDSSLGFTWALNSRENKLTPWQNDLRQDIGGERLFIKLNGKLYDIIRQSTVEFTPKKATYTTFLKGLELKTRVWVIGFTKHIQLEIINKGKTDKEVEAVFYLQPVLCDFPENARLLKWEKREDGLVFENPDSCYAGRLMIACEKSSSFVVDKQAFWQGDWYSEPSEQTKRPCAASVVKCKLSSQQSETIDFKLIYDYDFSMVPKDGSPENTLHVETPDASLNHLINTWLPWQVLGGRIFSRTSFYQNGGAYGFRDQLQDCLAAVYWNPSVCKAHILNSCTAQFPEGDVLHWWHELYDKQGQKIVKGVRTRYSDDLLWLCYTVYEYIQRTGDVDILFIKREFAQADVLAHNQHERYFEISHTKEKETVYEHCRRAVEKAYRKGRNGLLLMGCGDWNDGYNNVGIGGKGESVWLSMFYCIVCDRMSILATLYGDLEYAEELKKRITEQKKTIQAVAWDNEHYLRAFYDNGEPMGGNNNDMCKVDLLPQAFCVLAQLPDVTRSITAVNYALSQLFDAKNGIIKLFDPAFTEGGKQRPGYVASYPQGVRENGGQYTHGAIWFIIACYELGYVELGYELVEAINPAQKGEVFKNEPYYLSADVYTNPHCYGRGGWSLYTGAASWYYKCLLEQMLGIRIENKKLYIIPKIPKAWDGYRAVLQYQNSKINISVKRGEKSRITDNGKDCVYIALDGETHNVEVILE